MCWPRSIKGEAKPTRSGERPLFESFKFVGCNSLSHDARGDRGLSTSSRGVVGEGVRLSGMFCPRISGFGVFWPRRIGDEPLD